MNRYKILKHPEMKPVYDVKEKIHFVTMLGNNYCTMRASKRMNGTLVPWLTTCDRCREKLIKNSISLKWPSNEPI